MDRLEAELRAKAERLEQLEADQIQSKVNAERLEADQTKMQAQQIQMKTEQIKMKSDYLAEIVQLNKRIQQLESESSSKNHWQDQNGNNKKEAVDGLISSGA